MTAPPHEAGRTEDQNKDEQEIGHDRREFGDRHLPEVAEERRRETAQKLRRGKSSVATANVCTRPIRGRDECAGQRTQAADDDDEQNGPSSDAISG
jgi:hypothetical protein